MYRFLILLLVLIGADSHLRCHRNRPCNHKHRLQRYSNRNYERIFEDISQSVINIDKTYYGVCNENLNNMIREYFALDFYTLKYKLPEYTDKDFTIKVKHRVLYVNAQKQNGVTFRDIRILPRTVKAQEGQWFIEDNDLCLQFPYKIPLISEMPTSCDDVVDEKVNQVSKLKNNFELRTGDDSLLEQPNNTVITFNENFQ